MAATSRGATLLAPDKLEIREYPIPEIPPDGGLVKVEMGGVCGSDFKYLHGGKNGLPYPLILGHEILGRVEKLGKEAAAIHGIKEGDRIIMKGAKGCGRCAHCRRGAARFCKVTHRLRRPDHLRQSAPSIWRLCRLSVSCAGDPRHQSQ